MDSASTTQPEVSESTATESPESRCNLNPRRSKVKRIMLREHCSANILRVTTRSVKGCTTKRRSTFRKSRQRRAAPHGNSRACCELGGNISFVPSTTVGLTFSHRNLGSARNAQCTLFYETDVHTLPPCRDVQWEDGQHALSHLRLCSCVRCCQIGFLRPAAMPSPPHRFLTNATLAGRIRRLRGEHSAKE